MSTWSRRHFLTLAAAAAAASGALAVRAMPLARTPRAGDESLDLIAQRKGMRFGSAMAYHQLSDPAYCGLMRTQCGIMVTENECWNGSRRAPTAHRDVPSPSTRAIGPSRSTLQ